MKYLGNIAFYISMALFIYGSFQLGTVVGIFTAATVLFLYALLIGYVVSKSEKRKN